MNLNLNQNLNMKISEREEIEDLGQVHLYCQRNHVWRLRFSYKCDMITFLCHIKIAFQLSWVEFPKCKHEGTPDVNVRATSADGT